MDQTKVLIPIIIDKWWIAPGDILHVELESKKEKEKVKRMSANQELEKSGQEVDQLESLCEWIKWIMEENIIYTNILSVW